MVVSEYMLYAWTALFFSITSRWCCYAILDRSRYLELIYFPVKILRKNLLPHPPDGLLLVVLTLAFILYVHLFALIYGIWSVLRTCIRKLRISARISYSRIKFALKSSTQFYLYGTLRKLKSRIFVSVPIKDCVFNNNADTKESFLVGHIFTSVAYTSDDIKDYDLSPPMTLMLFSVFLTIQQMHIFGLSWLILFLVLWEISCLVLNVGFLQLETLITFLALLGTLWFLGWTLWVLQLLIS